MTNKHLRNFRHSEFWQKLLTVQSAIKNKKINEFFLQDQNRFEKFSFKLHDLNLFVDFSKQHLDLNVIKILCDAAKYCELDNKIQDLFNGAKINITENKPAWHTMLRDPEHCKEVEPVLQKIDKFSQKLYKSNYDNILCLGIGGSYLGPVMVVDALDQYTHPRAKKIKFHFIANCDQETIHKVLNMLDPVKTIVIINSKSFTTSETILNAKTVIRWLQQQSSQKQDKIYKQQIFAVTCNVNKAMEFGIIQDNIFPFAEFIGGRYSVWSAVGLPVIIKIGIENFKKFLQGAYLVDQHFRNTDFSNNIPVLMALISIWNINFMQYKSLAVIPYLDSLGNFPAYLQQLAMESNGKMVDLQNNYIDYDSVEIVWGGVGCNVQHSFMQMLHQGTQIVPVDFLVAANNSKFLLANCLAQSQALMQGNKEINNFKQCNGNRPSTTIMFSKLTPEILGGLIALYEHKTFVQGVLWNINCFDQWGVELGKTFANNILNKLDNLNTDNLLIDNDLKHGIQASTIGLMNEYFEFRQTIS